MTTPIIPVSSGGKPESSKETSSQPAWASASRPGRPRAESNTKEEHQIPIQTTAPPVVEVEFGSEKVTAKHWVVCSIDTRLGNGAAEKLAAYNKEHDNIHSIRGIKHNINRRTGGGKYWGFIKPDNLMKKDSLDIWKAPPDRTNSSFDPRLPYLMRAFKGADAVLLSQDTEKTPKLALESGMRKITAAINSRVKHIVLVTPIYNQASNEISWACVGNELEDYVKEEASRYKIGVTLLRHGDFFETLLEKKSEDTGLPRYYDWLSFPDRLYTPLDRGQRLACISSLDLGRIAGLIMLEPARYIDKTVEVAADNISGAETVKYMNSEWNLNRRIRLRCTYMSLQRQKKIADMCSCFCNYSEFENEFKFVEWKRNSDLQADYRECRREWPWIMDHKAWIKSLPKVTLRPINNESSSEVR